MATISKEALQWIQDEMEAIQAQLDDVEEELELALEENAALRLQVTMLMSDRSLAV